MEALGGERSKEEEEVGADGGNICNRWHLALLTRQHGCFAVANGTHLSSRKMPCRQTSL